MFERLWKKILRRKGLSLWSIPAGLLGIAALIYWPLSIYNRVRKRTQVKVNVPVISIGNISVGGSGKTPLVEFLARQLMLNDFRVGIVSSGYGRTIETSFLESGHNVVNMSVEETGDEVMLLAHTLHDALFSVDRQKFRAAERLASSGKVDLIIVDDGFQHHQLARDFDIVTFDAAVPRRNQKLLPFGLLREPFDTIRLADAVIITRANIAKDITGLQKRLKRHIPSTTTVYSANFMMDELVGKSQTHPIKYLEDKRVFIFAGIGSFSSFRKQIKSLAAGIDGQLELGDHQKYDMATLEKIKKLAAKKKSDVIITTAKDWVKIGDFDFGIEHYYVSLAVDLDPGEEKLVQDITKKLNLKPHGVEA